MPIEDIRHRNPNQIVAGERVIHDGIVRTVSAVRFSEGNDGRRGYVIEHSGGAFWVHESARLEWLPAVV